MTSNNIHLIFIFEDRADEGDKPETDDTTTTAPAAPGKYVPPSMRSGGNTAGSSMPTGRGSRGERQIVIQ